MKKIVGFFFLFIVILVLTGCSYGSKKTDALKFKEEYESLNDKEVDGVSKKKYRKVEINKDNPMQYKSAKELVKMIEKKKTFIVYFGFDSCPWCRSVLPSLLEVAHDLEVSTIYYVDVKEIRDVLKLDENNNVLEEKKGTDDYYKLLELLDRVLEKYTLKKEDGEEKDTKEKRIYAPSVISIVDGKAKKLETGISEKQTDGYMKLTDEMKKETYDKFKCSIKCVLESSNTCSSKNSC